MGNRPFLRDATFGRPPRLSPLFASPPTTSLSHPFLCSPVPGRACNPSCLASPDKILRRHSRVCTWNIFISFAGSSPSSLLFSSPSRDSGRKRIRKTKSVVQKSRNMINLSDEEITKTPHCECTAVLVLFPWTISISSDRWVRFVRFVSFQKSKQSLFKKYHRKKTHCEDMYVCVHCPTTTPAMYQQYLIENTKHTPHHPLIDPTPSFAVVAKRVGNLRGKNDPNHTPHHA